MRQFYTLKARHPDAILFFQMGDFYETFGEDAELVSRELEITLTSRGRDASGERMPLAGVPVHAAGTYISRLVQRGYRVAVCDQIEDPKKARGIVKRDVVRIITPGTIIDPGMLGSAEPSYLMSLVQDSGSSLYGMAFLDISTGEFFVTEHATKNDFSGLFSEISRYSPSECIVSPGITDSILHYLTQRGVVVTPYPNEALDESTSRALLIEQFGVSSLEGYGCGDMHAAISAAGACLKYAKETQKDELVHINSLSTRLSSSSMVLDAITLRNLEIIRSIRNNDTAATLLGVLDITETPMGSRILRSFFASPLINREQIDNRLDTVEYFFHHPLIRASISALLTRFADIERIAGRISYGNAGPRDLVSLCVSLERIPELKKTLREGGSDKPLLLTDAIEGMYDFGSVVDLIKRALVDEPPALLKNGGIIREKYDRTLDELRNVASSGKIWIAEFQQKERERTGIKSLKVGYNRVFGYYIEVTKTNLHLVPPEYRRKQTTANGERFTLPELQEKESLISNAEERLNALEVELFNELVNTLKGHVPELQTTARNVGILDVFACLAEVGQKNGYVRPVVDESERLIIREGRHPVVEQNLGKAFVPNDTEMDSTNDQILIITGANMAGKSTYMRTIAQICIMAQMGSFVPASHATIGIVDRIFTRVGAFDDLASGQSTFMVEMLELANILNNMTTRSLVILDEIGRGTSTLDGFSIAKAVLEFLHGKISSGPRTLFATHFHELVEIETELKRVKNYHFAVKDKGDDVVFLRKLIPGATDRSYGIHVAMLAGIPRKVTGRAEEILLEAMRREFRGDGKKMPRYTQMLLIDNPEVPPADHPVVDALKGIDLNMMTPMDALLTLHDLQRKANGE
jgi:DNA mismatch repair protein MutS